MERRFKIDFFELSFLIEACIPSRPIARTMFWHDVIDKYYFEMTKEERARLHEWMNKNPMFNDSLEKEPDSRVFNARFDPNNQYIVTALGDDYECFKMGDRYYTKRNTWIDPDKIENVQHINQEH